MIGVRARRELCHCILDDIEPVGRTIGNYAGDKIPEAVRDRFGRLLVYAGIAPRTASGKLDPDALARGEFIVAPGLIYRLVPSTHPYRLKGAARGAGGNRRRPHQERPSTLEDFCGLRHSHRVNYCRMPGSHDFGSHSVPAMLLSVLRLSYVIGAYDLGL